MAGFMEYIRENDDARSSTPPDREILLRTRSQPEDRRDHQEKRLQLLLQEAEELNARLQQQLASSQNRQSQQACASVPAALRKEAEPSTRAPSLNETQAPQRNLEPKKRPREQQTSQVTPYRGKPPHHIASPDSLSEASSSRTSPHGRASVQRMEGPVGYVVRARVPQERQTYINAYPEKEGTSSHATKYRAGHERQAQVNDAFYPASKHPRQTSQDGIGRRLDDMLSTPFGRHIIAYEHRVGYVVPKF